ncbi:alpha/beta fold hydrolase [Marinibaculum pumilum]|uniref:Alpha/beta fold hydrolase n=1 Tax=Marinibaculum pumilum TaxID=1766165 RepID=A0ABV7KTL7_9PROT
MGRTTGIRVRDTILWFDDSGESDLPVVLCLHSLWLDRTMFDGFAAAARGRFRVVRPDFRGQGQSAPATEEVVTMEECADDMEAFIEALGLKEVHLLAQSMGGDVALRLVAKRPDLFASLTMAGSSARGEPEEQMAWIESYIESARRQGGFKGENLDTLMGIMFGESTRNDPSRQAMLQHWRDRMSATNLSLWPAILGVGYRKGILHLLSGIATPTLIISGAEDPVRPPAWSDEVAAGLQNARLVRVPKVGHSPTLEAPEQVLPQILDFIGERALAATA